MWWYEAKNLEEWIKINLIFFHFFNENINVLLLQWIWCTHMFITCLACNGSSATSEEVCLDSNYLWCSGDITEASIMASDDSASQQTRYVYPMLV